MYGKLKITGTIQVVTGLHIGGSTEFAAIGAVNSPVIRDPLTHLPIIPGSSIKGKLRSLLARNYVDKLSDLGKNHDNDPSKVIRLFGTSASNNNVKGQSDNAQSSTDKTSQELTVSRLQFFDCFLSNQDDLSKRLGESNTNAIEIKTENTITRLTGTAKPRSIERIIPQAEFAFQCVYDIYGDTEEEIRTDFEVLAKGLGLLQLDYLGGNGTRGYGRIRFIGLNVENPIPSQNFSDGNFVLELSNILKNAVGEKNGQDEGDNDKNKSEASSVKG